jgi:hypothetical protein
MNTLTRIERGLAVVFAALSVSAIVLFGLSLVPNGIPTKAVASAAESVDELPPPPAPELNTYIEVIDGCGPYFQGACVNIRSGPGATYADVGNLRTGMVLRVGETRVVDGETWYRVIFDESVRYPERISKQWWVAGAFVRVFKHEGPNVLKAGATATSSKRIEVDRTLQMLYAYDGDTLFMKQQISTGLDDMPTPRGYFKVFSMTPSRYMQGPLPGISEQYYDLPGVPWDIYFTHEGAAIHGAYWHDKFGEQWSHGCVNVPVEKARELYEWAELGMTVWVHD